MGARTRPRTDVQLAADRRSSLLHGTQPIAFAYSVPNETTAVILDFHLGSVRVLSAADVDPLGVSMASHVRKGLLDDAEGLHPLSDVEAEVLQDALLVKELRLDMALFGEARDIFGHDDIERAIDIG